MSDFKDKHGKTRVGQFLETLGERAAPIAAEILNVAAGATGIRQLEHVADLIKGSDHLDEHEKQMALELLEMDKQEMLQVTERWKADMTSDSWLSKNARPITLLYLLLVMTVLVILDSGFTGFVVQSVWIDLIKSLLITVVLAYFGSRGVEKFTKIKGK